MALFGRPNERLQNPVRRLRTRSPQPTDQEFANYGLKNIGVQILGTLGYRIVAGATPGIATENAPDGKIEAFEGTMLDDGLTCVLATSGSETAGRRSHRRDNCLVEADGRHQEHYQETTDEAEHGFNDDNELKRIVRIKVSPECASRY